MTFIGSCDGYSDFTPSNFLSFFWWTVLLTDLRSVTLLHGSAMLTRLKSKIILNHLVMMHNLENEEHICCIFYSGFSGIYNSRWSVSPNLQRVLLCFSGPYSTKEMFSCFSTSYISHSYRFIPLPPPQEYTQSTVRRKAVSASYKWGNWGTDHGRDQ